MGSLIDTGEILGLILSQLHVESILKPPLERLHAHYSQQGSTSVLDEAGRTIPRPSPNTSPGQAGVPGARGVTGY